MTERKKSLLTQRDWEKLEEMVERIVEKALKERGHRDHIHHGGYDGARDYVDDFADEGRFGVRRVRGFHRRGS